ncbi:MAG: response regulator transcription factor [Rhodospirillales bacterium]|nr:response regulator transcription factor [Rhodospirillales bacterium]
MNARRHIVVAEDDPDVIEVIQEQWRDGGKGSFIVIGNPLIDLLPSRCTRSTVILFGLTQFKAFGRPICRRIEEVRKTAKVILVLREAQVMDALDYIDLCDGFLFIDRQPERLHEVIDLAIQGYCLFPRTLLSVLASRHLRLDILPTLSEGEAEVLSLLGQGLTNKFIAQRLGIRDSTVKNLVRSVLRKMHFRNRTEAGIFAFRYLAADVGMGDQSPDENGEGSDN